MTEALYVALLVSAKVSAFCCGWMACEIRERRRISRVYSRLLAEIREEEVASNER